MSRSLLLSMCAGLVLLAGAPAGAVARPMARSAAARGAMADVGPVVVPAAVVYSAPLPPPLRVVHPFAPPSTPYGPGERGVDLGTSAGAVVRAAADGQVRFAGPVAGRGVVVLVHADGVSTEYEPLKPLVTAGSFVARGQPIGTVAGRHPGCVADGCLHWGATREKVYFDPLTLLRALGPVRLLPWVS